jgi:UDP-glucose 4-epimerase
MVYGPRQRDFTKLIRGSIVKLLRGAAPKITSGERPMDWAFVEDLVDELLAAALAPGIDGRTGGIRVRQVVETLAELVLGSRPREV